MVAVKLRLVQPENVLDDNMSIPGYKSSIFSITLFPVPPHPFTKNTTIFLWNHLEILALVMKDGSKKQLIFEK